MVLSLKISSSILQSVFFLVSSCSWWKRKKMNWCQVHLILWHLFSSLSSRCFKFHQFIIILQKVSHHFLSNYCSLPVALLPLKWLVTLVSFPAFKSMLLPCRVIVQEKYIIKLAVYVRQKTQNEDRQKCSCMRIIMAQCKFNTFSWDNKYDQHAFCSVHKP